MADKKSFSSFANYKQTVIDLINDLNQLKEISNQLELSGNSSAIEEVVQRLTEDTFRVAIIGEFKRGKSTLINALLGKDILPMDVLPTTATLNKIAYSITPFAQILYKDGQTEEIEIDKLAGYVTKLTQESAEKAKTVKEATVYYPVNYCKNGIEIIDTPGLNDDEAMSQVTMSVLPQIDAAIFVVMAQSPFSESERSFLENKVITSDLGKVLFVVTGIDLLDEEDVDRVLNDISRRIQEHVMKKAENRFGKDSDAYADYQRKIGNIRIYGLSAKKALKAKIKGDNDMLEKSGFQGFETSLEKFLTEDRGMIMLNVPVNRIKTSCIEIVKAIQLRENGLKMKQGEFDKKYGEAMAEIEHIRDERKREFEQINETAQSTYDKLLPMIRDFWPSVEKAASQAIAGYAVSIDDISSLNVQDTQEAMLKVVKERVASVGQNLTERIQDSINSALEGEAERLSGFEKNFFEATERIQKMFTVDAKSDGNEDFIVSAIASSILGYGIGGIYMGYKEAGWKGALLGGATSIATVAGASWGVSLLFTALAIPATWPVLLIATAALGVLGTFTGKKVLDKAFAGDKIDKFKKSFEESVLSGLSKARAESHFSEDVRTQVDQAFDALKKKIRTETENILNDTQKSLTNLKVELAQSSLNSEKEEARLKNYANTVNTVAAHANEVGQQLAVIMQQ